MSLLVLSRRKDEALHIGNDIKVIVTKITKGRVYLGVDAPKSTVVMRGEKARAAGGNDAGSR